MEQTNFVKGCPGHAGHEGDVHANFLVPFHPLEPHRDHAKVYGVAVMCSLGTLSRSSTGSTTSGWPTGGIQGAI